MGSPVVLLTTLPLISMGLVYPFEFVEEQLIASNIMVILKKENIE